MTEKKVLDLVVETLQDVEANMERVIVRNVNKEMADLIVKRSKLKLTAKVDDLNRSKYMVVTESKVLEQIVLPDTGIGGLI